MGVTGASRRDFLRGLGVVSANAALGSGLLMSAASSVSYVRNAESIAVFRKVDSGWRETQSVPSRCPAFLATDASGRFMFAVNEIGDYLDRPTGSVESYSVDPGSGQLTLISRQSLSLSATMPRHFAISPDQRWMVVAAFGGGAYNVLPIHGNGEIGRVCQIVKEIGCGSHAEKQRAAHPHSLVFHPGGKFVISTDFGSDRVTAFLFEDGQLIRKNRIAVQAGSGPGKIRMNPSGDLVFVSHELRPSQSCYQFDVGSGLTALRA